MALDPAMPVLVVDDYVTMVRIIRNLLKQIGFDDVDDANDGSTALAKCIDGTANWVSMRLISLAFTASVRRSSTWSEPKARETSSSARSAVGLRPA